METRKYYAFEGLNIQDAVIAINDTPIQIQPIAFQMPELEFTEPDCKFIMAESLDWQQQLLVLADEPITLTIQGAYGRYDLDSKEVEVSNYNIKTS